MPTSCSARAGSDVREPAEAAVSGLPANNFVPPTHRQRAIQGHEVVRALVRIGEHLVSTDTLANRLELLCKETTSLLHCDRSSIMLWDGDAYQATYNWGNPPDIAEVFPTYRVPAHAPVVIEMEAAASFVVINNAAAHSSVGGIAEKAGVKSMVVAPMVNCEGGRLGFLTAEFNEHLGVFDECRAEIVLGVARLAQTAVITDQERRRRRQADLGRATMHAKLVGSEDEERGRLARELHDEPIQHLYALQLRLETAEAQQTTIEPAEIARLASDARTASDSLRGMLTDVHPTAIDGRTLAQAVRLTLARRAERAGWESLIVDETTAEPTTANLTVLFRISLQALHNSAVHASASTVTIRLRTVDGGTEVRITDDGCGFDPATVGPDRFGLTSMRERAVVAGGSFSVDSQPGRGTEVSAWLPNGI